MTTRSAHPQSTADALVHARPTSVYLVDDHGMTRAGMRMLVEDLPDFEVVGDHGDARAAIDEITALRPDVVLLDISMPGLSGIDAVEPMRAAHPRVKIVMLSHHEGESFVEQSLQHGADGYMSKDSEPEELSLALRSVLRGQLYISPQVARRVLGGSAHLAGALQPETGRLSSLTPREREVFQLLAVGYSNKQVARELSMSLGTAKKHRENLQRKLDCHSSAELAMLAVREGLIEG